MARDLEPLVVRGPQIPTDDTLSLREVDGEGVMVRVTPVDDEGVPVDGGRVIVLRAGERRAVRLTDTLPISELAGRRLLVETLDGSGRAMVEASWLTGDEAAAAAATPHIPRRHLRAAVRPTSAALIEQAESSGALTHETAVLYRVYAIFGDARLPGTYRGDDSAVPDSLFLATVVSEWNSYAAATQAILQPFLIPPAYQQGYRAAAAGTASALSSPPSCTPDSNWDYVENTGGKVRIWFDVNTSDRVVAGVFLLQAENTIWPALERLMPGHRPLSDGALGCNGGSDQLDIYLCDQPQSVTVGYSGCSNSPVFIRLRRGTSVALLAHEMFHAFQWAMPLKGGACITSPDYRWWAEASAQWVQDYVYPFDQAEQTAAPALLSDPEQPLDLPSDPHWYGAYLLPFFVHRSTGAAGFMVKAWENCSASKATQALNDALAAAGPGDLAKVWPDFALHNWNQAPVDQYKKWDSLKDNVLPSVNSATVDAGFLPYREATLLVDLPHLSATYKHFLFSGSEISSVAFWNGITFDLEKQSAPIVGASWNPQPASPDAVKGIKVQALVKINGTWTQEDWTDKPFVLFCRDLNAERLQELVIVVSNSRLDDSAGSFKPPGMAPVLWVSGIGCYQWKGSASYTLAATTSTQADTVPDLVFTRVASQSPPAIDYVPTGNVNVTMGGSCSGGGTVPVTGQPNMLTTYNFLPADSPAVQSYSGQGLETATVNVTCDGHPGMTVVGPWLTIYPGNPPAVPFFTVSPDGKHMTATFSPTPGLTWQWDLHAVQEP